MYDTIVYTLTAFPNDKKGAEYWFDLRKYGLASAHLIGGPAIGAGLVIDLYKGSSRGQGVLFSPTRTLTAASPSQDTIDMLGTGWGWLGVKVSTASGTGDERSTIIVTGRCDNGTGNLVEVTLTAYPP